MLGDCGMFDAVSVASESLILDAIDCPDGRRSLSGMLPASRRGEDFGLPRILWAFETQKEKLARVSRLCAR